MWVRSNVPLRPCALSVSRAIPGLTFRNFSTFSAIDTSGIQSEYHYCRPIEGLTASL